MKKPAFSIILPIYNEEDQILPIYKSYTKILNSLRMHWELLLIINGSRDKSYQIAQSIAEKNSNILVFNLKKGGWGRAVKYGIKQAKGKYICYTNASRTDPKDLKKILLFGMVHDDTVVKATRIVRESWIRKFGSIIYNLENRLLLGTPVWDVNGTPKIFPRTVFDKITIWSEGDLIDAEIMAKCCRKGIPIAEYPIVSTKRLSGKSTTNFYSAYKMYKGVFTLKKLIDEKK